MKWEILTAFSSVIGVVVGFLLGILRDWLLNRPKLKVEIGYNAGRFAYYNEIVDKMGEIKFKRCSFGKAQFMELELYLDVYNVGKSATAVKTITVKIENKKLKQKRYFEPEYGEKCFNVPVGSIVSKNLKLRVYRDENTECFFQEIVSDPSSPDKLLFTVFVEDIYNEKHKLEVEPISIWLFGE